MREEIIFIDYMQLIGDVKDFCKRLNVGGVAGIPRSGVLIASIIAQELNIPLYFITNDSVESFRLDISRPINKHEDKPILIVDDTSWSGRAMNLVKNRKGNFIYGAIYCSSEQASKLDVYYKILPTMFHTFEWNILRDILVQHYFLDFDGVLCEDPQCVDDTEEYMDFLDNARPLYLPKYKVGAIVTARLEKYRSQTEKWLKKHDVKYHDLIMSPYSSSQERLRRGGFGMWKAGIYKHAPEHIKLFIESNYQQAREIFNVSRKPVFCTDEMKLYA